MNPGWQLRAINLSSPSVHVLAYDEQGEGLATEINPEAFGDPLPFDAHFVAEVRVTPHFPFQGISRVQAAVEAPAGAPFQAIQVCLRHADEASVTAAPCRSSSTVANFAPRRARSR